MGCSDVRHGERDDVEIKIFRILKVVVVYFSKLVNRFTSFFQPRIQRWLKKDVLRRLWHMYLGSTLRPDPWTNLHKVGFVLLMVL